MNKHKNWKNWSVIHMLFLVLINNGRGNFDEPKYFVIELYNRSFVYLPTIYNPFQNEIALSDAEVVLLKTSRSLFSS